jgi:hypothetical protein
LKSRLRVSLALAVAATPLVFILPASGDGLPDGAITQSAVSTQQYALANSDGTAWQEIDPTRLRVTQSPSSNQPTLLSASSDLWTMNPGFNQDLGIFVSDNGGSDQLVVWRESGGSAGRFSPNPAYVQTLFGMTSGHTYVFKLKWKTNKNALGATIYSGAGPIGGQFSPTSLTAKNFPLGITPNFVVKTNFSSLAGSDGATWQSTDAALATSLSPAASAIALLGGNADLWTDTTGYNQDLGIFVSDNGGTDQLVAWKESGGFGGTFSPNTTYVKAVYPMTAGHTYNFKLKWKTNKNAPGATIYAGAGPISGQWSPTSLLAETITTGANPYTGASTTQYGLGNSDGATWQPLDSALDLTVPGAANTNALLGANADLWTNTSGYNQDLGIFVNDNGGADTLVAWKESGGFAETFSPNAVFVQALYPMGAGHTYVFKLKWKTSNNAPGATIYAGAGPISGAYSPTSLSAETTTSAPAMPSISPSALSWAPPPCGDAIRTCQDVYLTNPSGCPPACPHQFLFSGGSPSADYRVHLPTGGPLIGGIDIDNGHNVIVIGGEIDLATPCMTDNNVCHGINISTGSTGEVYVEGVLIKNPDPTHSQYTGDGIDVNSSTLARLTLQNLRIEGIDGCDSGAFPSAHADVFQPYNAGGTAIRVDHLTGSSTFQGMQIDPDLSAPVSGDYRNVNINMLPNTHGCGGNHYGWWLTKYPTCNTYPMSLTNDWEQEPNGSLGLNGVWPDTDAILGCPAQYSGKVATWPNLPLVTGGVNNGLPPGGDFVPVGVAGLGYVSPGYQ